MDTLYPAMASITFVTILVAFIRDKETALEPQSILFILVATLLGPMTLPCIIFNQIQRSKDQQQMSQRYDARSSYSQRL